MILRVAAALILLSCSGEGRPSFCTDWLERSDAERRELLRDTLPGGGEREPGYRAPHLKYATCVASFVLDRAESITAACRSFGDLEGAVTLARLTAHGMEACVALRRPGLQ